MHASCQDIPEGVLGRAHDLPPVKFRVFLDGDDHKMKSLLYQAALKKRSHGLQNFMSKNIFDNFVLTKWLIESPEIPVDQIMEIYELLVSNSLGDLLSR